MPLLVETELLNLQALQSARVFSSTCMCDSGMSSPIPNQSSVAFTLLIQSITEQLFTLTRTTPIMFLFDEHKEIWSKSRCQDRGDDGRSGARSQRAEIGEPWTGRERKCLAGTPGGERRQGDLDDTRRWHPSIAHREGRYQPGLTMVTAQQYYHQNIPHEYDEYVCCHSETPLQIYRKP